MRPAPVLLLLLSLSLPHPGVWGLGSPWSRASLAQMVPMPQSVSWLREEGGDIALGGVLLCLDREAFSDGRDNARLLQALRREAEQRGAGSDVALLSAEDAPAEQGCVDQAARRAMTAVVFSQRSTIEGLSSGADQRAGADHDLSEAYSLEVADAHVIISAHAPAGAYRGMQTLMQLCFLEELDRANSSAQGGCRIPAVRILDWPDLAHRGVMLDVSRNRVPTMETAQHIIDTLSALKINQLQMYTEHTFAYSNHTTVWAQSGAITPAEARHLSQYAYERFITLVPNQQSFGHMQHWLKHPEYAHLAESKSGSRKLWAFDYCCPLFSDAEFVPYSLAPNKASLALLSNLYDELLAAFPHSRAVNIGMDETFDLGDGASREDVARVGKHTVYADFLNNISAVLEERGAHAQFWGDIIFEHPHLFLGKLSKETRVLDWGYEADAPFASRGQALKRHGIKSYVAPGTSSWLSFGGRVTNCVRNVVNAAQSGAWFGAEGLLITDWGDGGYVVLRISEYGREGLSRGVSVILCHTNLYSHTWHGVYGYAVYALHTHGVEAELRGFDAQAPPASSDLVAWLPGRRRLQLERAGA